MIVPILDGYELGLVQNAGMLYAKNNIIKKVVDLFSQLSEEYKKCAENFFPSEYLEHGPKISKGEKYLDLPYVILDYPRIFTKENKFAVRTLFWWGHSFSIHLHLAGVYKTLFEKTIASEINKGIFNGWYIGVNQDEWQHHFSDDNYVLLNNIGQFKHSLPFIKLAKKIPLNEWNNIHEFFLENFCQIANWFSLSSLSGEKAP